jgi:hypothetical protein
MTLLPRLRRRGNRHAWVPMCFAPYGWVYDCRRCGERVHRFRYVREPLREFGCTPSLRPIPATGRAETEGLPVVVGREGAAGAVVERE